MKNLFESMGAPTQEELEWEEVGGSFACQEYTVCEDVATTAKYSPVIHVLTWVCKDNHISKIENFTL